MSRERSLQIRNILDNWMPPAIRDSKILMYPLLFLVFGKRFRYFAEFKARGFSLSPEEFSGVYEVTADLQKIQGATDLNDACVDAILQAVAGTTVLDVGCGRGYLVDRLAEVGQRYVTGCDIVIDPDLTDRPRVQFRQSRVEDLPFQDDEFDSVVCTHTLEHVQDIQAALSELRRVARRRLILVVPKERPYRYSFNLHLHFFPYPWSWEAVAGHSPRGTLCDLGDWLYVEDI